MRLYFILRLLLALDIKIAMSPMSPSDMEQHTFVRCTRRFTPGMCQDSVEPVWTFAFQQQNCTERLGCPSDWRVNRFKSYKKCMRRCKSLVNIYTEFLIKEADNLTDFHLRSRMFGAFGRRDIEYYDKFADSEEYTDKVAHKQIEGPAPDPTEYEEDQTHHQYTIDIDYVETEESVHGASGEV